MEKDFVLLMVVSDNNGSMDDRRLDIDDYMDATVQPYGEKKLEDAIESITNDCVKVIAGEVSSRVEKGRDRDNYAHYYGGKTIFVYLDGLKFIDIQFRDKAVKGVEYEYDGDIIPEYSFDYSCDYNEDSVPSIIQKKLDVWHKDWLERKMKEFNDKANSKKKAKEDRGKKEELRKLAELKVKYEGKQDKEEDKTDESV